MNTNLTSMNTSESKHTQTQKDTQVYRKTVTLHHIRPTSAIYHCHTPLDNKCTPYTPPAAWL